MMMLGFLAIPIALGWSVYAQSSSSVVCVAGQCMQGYANVTIGARLTASGAPTSIQLLPGQYTTTTNPQLLHDILTSPSASLSPSPGFENSTSSTSLPLNLALEPGLAIFSQTHYSGQSGFSKLPTAPVGNTSTPLTAGSIALSSNVWVALTTGSNSRIVLWDSVPDVNQLPSGAARRGLALVDVQSTACSPACAGSGVCSAAGTCVCPPGFTGSSCESCEKGFFGPTCQPCPAGCTSCDDGISGSGRCLAPVLANAPSTCNCLNGQCGSDGQCACNAGWTTADNGTACAKCASGFFQTSTGDCQVCQLGCTQCADGTGACIACKSGFTQDANDKTKCNPVQSVTSTGTVCPDGSFSDGAKCSLCSPSCKTCSGPTSNDCVICAAGQYMFNGHCIGTNSDGVCEGSSLIANNNKHECDTCGAKCTSCKIPNFSVASTVDQAQCTGCLPGFVLSQGRCVESCPSGSFVSPQDNLTCIPCSSSCGTCAGSADFCLTCPGNRLASSGKCVDACPSNTFSSSGSCLTCHPDCASCSGLSFTQCSSCPPNRPVLANGRCLPTCGKSQYFDTTTSTCQACDSSCSSCSGAGPSSCLACSNANQVLRAGACVAASCEGSAGVIPGLGVCLSELVRVPAPSGTGGGAPALPSITGLTNPTVVHTTTRRPLAWWEILLMTLGCAFIFLVVLMLWRRRARRQRAKRTVRFATAKNLVFKPTWRWRLARLFGRGRPCNFEHVHPYVYPYPRGGVGLEERKARDLGEAEEARGGSGSRRDTRLHLSDDELDNFINAYDYSRSSRAPSTLPSLHDYHNGSSQKSGMKELKGSNNRLSLHSLYSQVTGVPRQMPEPRQPVRKELLLPLSRPASSGSSARYSSSTLASSNGRHPGSADAGDSGGSAMAGGGGWAQIQERAPSLLPGLDSVEVHRQPTEAEAYAMAVRPMLVGIEPNQTSGSSSSRNPFRML